MNPPTKPADNRYRVFRGGGWSLNVPSWVRAASRLSHEPAHRYNDLGFRCARVGCERKVKP